jgi:large subunit ribosomal protein L13
MGDITMRKTFVPKVDDIQKEWYIVDATNLILGRMATRIADVLRGKHKPMFAPNVDTGDFVVVVNADKVKLSGKKLLQKIDFRHSGWPGGAKFTQYDKLMRENPEKAVLLAVRGMLPKNKLRSKFIKKLHIYRGENHPHVAQSPKALKIAGKAI